MNQFLRAVFINSNLGLLWVGQVVAKFGESLFGMSVVFLAMELTESSTATGFVQMSSYLPILVFGLVAGAYIDKSSKRSVMMASDVGRAVLVALIPILFFTKLLTALLLGAIAFLIAALSAFFVPARNAIIPELASEHPEERTMVLLKANSLVQTSEQLAFLVAPLAVGAIGAAIGTIHLFTITAATFFTSYLFIICIKAKEPQNTELVSIDEVLRDSLTSLKKVASNQRLRDILVITSLNNLFLMGAAIVGTPIFIKTVLNKGIETFALIEFIFAVMMLLVSFLLNVFAERVKKIGYEKIWAFGLLMDGVSYCPYAVCNTVEQVSFFAALHASFIILIVVPRTTMIQRLVSSEDLGKVFSLQNVAVSGMTAVSSAATGWLCDAIGVREVFFGIGILAGLCGVWAWRAVVEPQAKAEA